MLREDRGHVARALSSPVAVTKPGARPVRLPPRRAGH